MTDIRIPISPGELIDKLSILQLKLENILDAGKRRHVHYEHALLQAIADEKIPTSPELTALRQKLYEINRDLWEIEEALRVCEANQEFGSRFVKLARSVYAANDARARVKMQINRLLGSPLVEEKSYQETDTI